MKSNVTKALAVAAACGIFAPILQTIAAPAGGRPGPGLGQSAPVGIPGGGPQIGRGAPSLGQPLAPANPSQHPFPPQVPQISNAPQQNSTAPPSPTPRRGKSRRAQAAPRQRVSDVNGSGPQNEVARERAQRNKDKEKSIEAKPSDGKSKGRKSAEGNSSHSQALGPKMIPVVPKEIPSASPMATAPVIQAPAAPPPVIISQTPQADPRTLEPVWTQLSPDERAKFQSAHQAALRDPVLQQSRQRYREAQREYRDRLREGLLKADPSVQPILEKIKKRRPKG